MYVHRVCPRCVFSSLTLSCVVSLALTLAVDVAQSLSPTAQSRTIAQTTETIDSQPPYEQRGEIRTTTHTMSYPLASTPSGTTVVSSPTGRKRPPPSSSTPAHLSSDAIPHSN